MSVLCSTKIFDISNEISGKWKSGELSREARRSACCGLVQPGSTIFFDFSTKKAQFHPITAPIFKKSIVVIWVVDLVVSTFMKQPPVLFSVG